MARGKIFSLGIVNTPVVILVDEKIDEQNDETQNHNGHEYEVDYCRTTDHRVKAHRQEGDDGKRDDEDRRTKMKFRWLKESKVIGVWTILLGHEILPFQLR